MNILCPVCKNKLVKVEHSLQCSNGHNFDIAKQGYVNLNMHNSQNTGDNAEMINARTIFLNKGYYLFLLDEINKHLSINDKLLDLACGEGYYTSKFICEDKIGIDLSKQGLKNASKNDKTTTYLLNSIFHNPLQDKSVDKIVTIFAPIAKEEIVRLLNDNGSFILVKPDENHLFELKKAVYDNPYLNEIENIRIDGMYLDSEIKISNHATLNNDELHNLFMMTPYYNTTSKVDKDKLNNIDKLDVTFSFIIDIYKKA